MFCVLKQIVNKKKELKKYMNSPSFHSSHYFNSPLILQLKHETSFHRILFSRAHLIIPKGCFMSNYMNRYGFRAWPLYLYLFRKRLHSFLNITSLVAV